MTTLTRPLSVDLPALGALGRSALVAFGATILASLFVLGVAAAGYAQLHANAIFPGVTVGGVPVGGLERAAAEQALRAGLPPLDSGWLTVRLGDEAQRVEYRQIGRDYALSDMLDTAFAVGRAGGPLGQAGEQLRTLTSGVDVAPRVTWDEERLVSVLTALTSGATLDARDATVVEAGGRYEVVPAQAGRAFDISTIRSMAVAAISRPVAGDATIEIAPQTIEPGVATETASAAVSLYDNASRSAVVAYGGGINVIVDTSTVRQWLSLQPDAVNGGWGLVVNREAIAAHLAQQAASIDRPPVEASFVLEADGVRAVAGSTGQALDVTTSTDRLAELLMSRSAGGGSSSGELAISFTEPELSTTEAIDYAGRIQLVSTWTTRFVPGENNFNGLNIRLPAQILNGTIVAPGERFSFLDAVGPFSAERGFGPGGAIIRGRTNPTGAMGGGICSASTTLFNAALRGGYEIVDRTQHSYYIGRYPVGLDATVWRSGASKRDMVFVNDSEHPLWIRGIARRKSVTFELWSIPDGRTVAISKPRVENRREAEDKVVYVDTLAPGVEKRVEYPVDGFDSSVTRVVRDASGRVLHQDTFVSRYITVTGITEVGITPEPPPDEEPPPEEEPPAEPPPSP